MATDLTLNLVNGTRLVVPSRLDAMTTYVLLEQERWFEKEWGFMARLLQPGMTAIDIGANLGTYTMALAKAVGPSGRVFAYEPTSETRSRLERTKAENSAEQVTIIASALSDTEREGRIVFGSSSELNHLGSASEGNGEQVHLTSLDLESARLGWGHIDFVKMDAEGEELRIIDGGKSVFEADAPIVMFEIKSTIDYDLEIGRALERLGYELYRLLPDEKHLVPFDESEVDGFELNLFAVKPVVASALEARDVLATGSDHAAAEGNWEAWSRGKAFAEMQAQMPETTDDAYSAGLDFYAGWRDESYSIGRRYAALRQALVHFSEALERRRSIPRILAAARANYDAGLRLSANMLTGEAAKLIDAGGTPEEQFPPLVARYEDMAGALKGWVTMSWIEAIEMSTKFSGYFGKIQPQLSFMAGSKYFTVELERRRALAALVTGSNLELRFDLGKSMPGHLNAETWARMMG